MFVNVSCHVGMLILWVFAWAYACLRMCVYCGCVVFVCVSGYVCIVIVYVCVSVCMFVNVCGCIVVVLGMYVSPAMSVW